MVGWVGDTLLYPPSTPQLAPTLAGSGLGGAGGLSRAGGGRAASRSLSLGKMIRILGGAGARSPRTGHEPVGVVVRPDPQTLPAVAPDPQTLPMAGVGGPKAMNERGRESRLALSRPRKAARGPRLCRNYSGHVPMAGSCQESRRHAWARGCPASGRAPITPRVGGLRGARGGAEAPCRGRGKWKPVSSNLLSPGSHVRK